MADGKVRIQIDTNAGKATNELKGFDKVIKDTKKDGKELVDSNNLLERSMNKLTSSAKKLVGAYIGLQGVKAVTGYVLDSVEAFRTQERAIIGMDTALINAGVYTQQYSQHLQELASSIQAYSNYGDEAIEKSIGLAQSFAGQVKLTDELIKATVDFASAMDMDLESAFTLVGKSIGSSTNALGRYGVELQKGMTDSQKMQAIVEQLGARYDGQAKNMANASVQLKNALGDLSEAIGGIFTPSITNATNALTKFAQKLVNVANNIRIFNAENSKLGLTELQKKLELVNKEIAFTEKTSDMRASKSREYMAQLKNERAEILKQIETVKNLETVKAQTSRANAIKFADETITTPKIKTSSSKPTKTKQIQEEKTAYDLLQESVRKYREEVFNTAITYGTSSEQVAQAMTHYKEANQQLVKIQELFNEKVEKTDKTLKDGKKSYDDLSQSISTNIVSALANGGNAFQSFAGMAISALEKVIAKVLELAVITPLINSFTGGFGGSLLSGLFAKGGAFENGVQKFASGGVVNKPTTFAMAGDKTGLMGEAGAEAIMPLKRTASGDLGIQATQPNINIYNQSGAQIETVERPDGDVDLFIKRVNNALSNERTQQGFSRALQRNDTRGLQAS